ncbi:DUF4825 domain-containing protein [Virgibacillus flavescens]|uniref:DUF4825 domain-containing protein n=1 Tax=Virgibacillus flavescens TaxID=1611422 RepID=UPI003D345B87
MNEDLYEYEGSVTGDNSAVISISKQLEHGEEFKEVELETGTEPYGMTATYEGMGADITEKDYKETAISNASFLFALIENAEWAAFDFEDREYKITRAALEDFYGKDLREFAGEDELKSVTKELLMDDESVNQFFESEG